MNKLALANREQIEFNDLVNFGSEESIKAAIAKRIETREIIENTIAKLRNKAASMSKFGEDTKFVQIEGLKQDLRDLDKEFAALSVKLMDLEAIRRKGARLIAKPPGDGAQKSSDIFTQMQRQKMMLRKHKTRQRFASK